MIIQVGKRINETINPYGYFVEELREVPDGWAFRIQNGDEFFECFLKDVQDSSLSKLMQATEMIQ